MNEAEPADPESGADGGRSRRLGVLWLPLVLLVVLHLGSLARDGGAVLHGVMDGPDSYMRLVRVAELAESRAWHSSLMPRSNTPYGEILHWTRPFDVLLLAGGAAFGLGGGLDAGLRLWSLIFGPLLHLAAVVALIWSTRPLLDRQTQFLMALMALFQASVFYQFLPGRVDHHGLQALLFVVLTGLGIRIVGTQASPRLPFVAGAFAALAVWLSVEGGLAIAVALAAIVVVWLTRPAEGALAGLRFSAAAALGLALAIAIERPPAAWLADEYDRMSIVHLWAFVLIALFWLCLRLWLRR
jgi:asparagine N-glycosylation enzyme membrane subunit Stt3